MMLWREKSFIMLTSNWTFWFNCSTMSNPFFSNNRSTGRRYNYGNVKHHSHMRPSNTANFTDNFSDFPVRIYCDFFQNLSELCLILRCFLSFHSRHFTIQQWILLAVDPSSTEASQTLPILLVRSAKVSTAKNLRFHRFSLEMTSQSPTSTISQAILLHQVLMTTAFTFKSPTWISGTMSRICATI